MKRLILSCTTAAALLVAAGGVRLAAHESEPLAATPVPHTLIAEAKARKVDVLIGTRGHDYADTVAAIEKDGGKVTHRFKYAKGLAASVPIGALSRIARLPGVNGLAPDTMRHPASGGDNYRVGFDIRPLGFPLSEINEMDSIIRGGVAFDLDSKFATPDRLNLNASQIQALSAELSPDTYVNAAAMDAPPIWAGGNLGQDTIVAVIDTGIWADHFLFSDGAGGNRVVGCDDLSTDVGGVNEGCSRADNGFHGSHVASTIAGNGAALLAANSPVATAIARHAGPLPNGAPLGFPGTRVLPLLGVAPFAELYGVKVFPAAGGGASTARIISAIEHVVDLKTIGNVDIDVLNMSLGGGTTFVGRDLESMAVDAATAAGITVVTSAGNDGPASQTIGSPAGAHTAIDVAAMAFPLQVRVFWDFNFFPSFMGHKLFTSDTPQIVYFSSRGWAEDGRDEPVVSAPGAFVLAAVPSAASPQGLGFSSGTSMASPGVAGTVALLNHWSENNGDAALPLDYRQAIEAGAQLLPGYDAVAQGAGANNAWGAINALMADGTLGEVYGAIPPADPGSPVPPFGNDLGIGGGGSAIIEVDNLMPGMTQHYYFPTTRDASQILVDVSNVQTKKNPLGINSFEVYIKTGTRTYSDYYAESVNVFGDAHFEIMDRSTTVTGAVSGVVTSSPLIQPGYTRVVIENDWTSSGPMSGTFEISVVEDAKPAPDATVSDDVAEGASDFYDLTGLSCDAFSCRTDLTWDHDWTFYPTVDLDLILYGFEGAALTFLEVGGASLASPETNGGFLIPLVAGADVNNVDGVFAEVNGFDLHGGFYGATEPYTFDYYQP